MACKHGAAIGEACTLCAQVATAGTASCIACGQPCIATTYVNGNGPYHPSCAPNAAQPKFQGTCPKCGHTET